MNQMNANAAGRTKKIMRPRSAFMFFGMDEKMRAKALKKFLDELGEEEFPVSM
jgi:hypothetical protein